MIFHKSKKDLPEDESKAIQKKIDMLVKSVDKMYPNMHVLMARSFVQGLFVALGSTVGLAIFFTLLTVILSWLQVIPGLRDLIEYTHIDTVIENQQN